MWTKDSELEVIIFPLKNGKLGMSIIKNWGHLRSPASPPGGNDSCKTAGYLRQ